MTKRQQRELIFFNSHYFDCYHLSSRRCIVRIAKLQFPFRKCLPGCDRFCQRQVGATTFSLSPTTPLTDASKRGTIWPLAILQLNE